MQKTVLLNGSLASSLINFRGPLIVDLIAKGHKVYASAPAISPEIAARLRDLGAVPHSLSLKRDATGIFSDIRYAIELYRLIKTIRPGLVLNYTIKPNIWGALAAAAARTPSASMVTGLGFAFIPGGGIRRRAMQYLARRLYALATRFNRWVIFQNRDDLADFVSAKCLRDASKARLVDGSGVDTAEYGPAPLPDEPVFLMISRYLATKGLREYAQAALKVKASHPEWRLLLVGFAEAGPDAIGESEIAEWARQGLEVLGELNDVRPALLSSSIYVLPSYREGTPRSVLEAMAMARPVITTDAPGCRETVIDGVNGILVPVGDAEALAGAMVRLGQEPHLRRVMGTAGREMVERRYAVGKVNADLMRHLGL